MNNEEKAALDKSIRHNPKNITLAPKGYIPSNKAAKAVAKDGRYAKYLPPESWTCEVLDVASSLCKPYYPERFNKYKHFKATPISEVFLDEFCR